jgi:hypothetical protein
MAAGQAYQEVYVLEEKNHSLFTLNHKKPFTGTPCIFG